MIKGSKAQTWCHLVPKARRVSSDRIEPTRPLSSEVATPPPAPNLHPQPPHHGDPGIDRRDLGFGLRSSSLKVNSGPGLVCLVSVLNDHDLR